MWSPLPSCWENSTGKGHPDGLGEHLTLGEDWDTDTPAIGAPTISARPRWERHSRRTTPGITDADGLSNATFIYQWLGSRDREIQGAASATYTLVADDEGKTIKVRVTFTDDAGNNENADQRGQLRWWQRRPPPPPDNVHAVTQKSGAVELTWDAPDGATVHGYGIERRPAGGRAAVPSVPMGSPGTTTPWWRHRSAETGYTDESAGTRASSTSTVVSARNEAGPGEGSDWVRAGPASASNSPATGAPTISGTAQGGRDADGGHHRISDADGLRGGTSPTSGIQ